MRYQPFVMERWQSTYEHRVRFNLSESGVHPLSVGELLSLANLEPDALDVPLGYGQSNGSDELRNQIADLYPSTTEASVLVTTGGAEANFTAFWELLEPGSFHLIEKDGWQPDLNELEEGLRTGALWGRTDYTTIAPASLSDALARVALQPDTRGKILARTRKILTRNFALLSGWMDGQGGRFIYRPPDAGAICYTRYRSSINSTEFAETLRTEMDLLVVPGDHFGMDHYLRLGFGPPATELEVALERMGAAFDAVEQRSGSST